MARFDVVVVGLGAMGAAASAHLAGRGLRVLGLDRFTPPHDRGSSHGRSRIIRQAYFEGPDYVPLVLQAYELWERLARDSGRTLMTPCGSLMIGPPDGRVVTGTVEAASRHGLVHAVMTAGEVSARWPLLSPDPDSAAVFEEVAGVLDPEACVTAHLEMASRHGADLRTGVTVKSWQASDAGVTVTTGNGVHEADRLVLAPGAWAPELLLGATLEVERQVMAWFRPPTGDAGGYADLPLFLVDRDPAPAFYVLPDVAGDGVKVAIHHGGSIVDPDAVPGVTGDEVASLAAAVATHLPGLGSDLVRSVTCLYTNTPDEHFAIGVHPNHERVVVAAGFSGHGFKFSAAVGEAVADLVAGSPRPDLAMFAPARVLPS